MATARTLRSRSRPRRVSDASLDGADSPGASLLTLSNLNSGIIPHREFPLRKWYYTNPLWYYHAPATEHRLRMDAAFYERLDPLLREVCRVLLDAGLCTTPSCQGHFYRRQRFERIWEQLVREAAQIRSSGIVVRDAETDAAFRFHKPAYHLDWNDFAEFYEQVGRHQNQGYLGIAVPRDRPALVSRFESAAFASDLICIAPDGDLTKTLGQPVFCVRVAATSPSERDAAWSRVTTYIKELLSRPAAAWSDFRRRGHRGG